ncbi:transcriptional repressor [Patescibacteria group bacterium]|nr:transcriptional repressor [Patescibacteria group bacterium]
MPTTSDADLLRAHEMRATTPRLAVLSALRKTKYPMSAHDVAKAVRTKKVDMVTTYRTLESFKTAGIVTQVELQRGRAYYELSEGRKDHHHIVCINCDTVEDFTGCDYDALVKKALRQTVGFSSVTHHSLELFGMCTPCSKK